MQRRDSHSLDDPSLDGGKAGYVTPLFSLVLQDQFHRCMCAAEGLLAGRSREVHPGVVRAGARARAAAGGRAGLPACLSVRAGV